MSDSTPTSPPSKADLARYADMVALEESEHSDPMPEMVGDHSFGCGILTAKLHEACQLIDELRHAKAPADRDYLSSRVDRFFARLTPPKTSSPA